MEKSKFSDVSIEALKHILADTYILAVKTQNAHWNMRDQVLSVYISYWMNTIVT